MLYSQYLQFRAMGAGVSGRKIATYRGDNY